MTDKNQMECTTNAPLSGNAIESQDAKPSNFKRRHVVGGALTGVAAAVWHKPMINAIVLPAHAQMSNTLVFFAAAAAVTPIVRNDSLLDAIVSPAYAVAIETASEYAVQVVQTTAGVNSYSIDVFERKLEGESKVGELVYSGTATIGGSANLGVSDDPCRLELGPLAIELVSVDATEAVLNLTGAGGQLRVPAGTGSLPIPMCVDAGLPNSFFSDSPMQSNGPLGMNSIVDTLIPQAHAGEVGQFDSFGLSATKIDENNYQVEMLNFQGNILRRGTIRVDGQQGSLTFVSNACSGSGGNDADPIATTVTSVNQSAMELQLNLDGSNTSYSIPAASGTLMPSCAVTVSNFTTGRRQQSAQRSKSLLDALVPQAYAGIPSQEGPVVAFIANASYINGIFDVQIVGELAIPQAGGFNIEWSGSVPLNSATNVSAVDGCSSPATVTIVQRGRPNQFDITVAANGADTSEVLSSGTQMLPSLTQCPFDAAD